MYMNISTDICRHLEIKVYTHNLKSECIYIHVTLQIYIYMIYIYILYIYICILMYCGFSPPSQAENDKNPTSCFLCRRGSASTIASNPQKYLGCFTILRGSSGYAQVLTPKDNWPGCSVNGKFSTQELEIWMILKHAGPRLLQDKGYVQHAAHHGENNTAGYHFIPQFVRCLPLHFLHV